MVFVVDSQVGWTAAHASFLALAPPRRLVAWNKSDLQSTERESSDLRRDPASLATLADWSADARTPEERAIPVIPTSCLGEPGIGGLLEAISQCLIPVSPRVGEAVPMHPAIIGSLEAARLQVRAQNPSAALKCCESALRAEACE